MDQESIDKLVKCLHIMNEQLKTIADVCLTNQKLCTSIAETQQSIAKLIMAKNN